MTCYRCGKSCHIEKDCPKNVHGLEAGEEEHWEEGAWGDEEWNAEFARVVDTMSSTNDSAGGAQLFSAEFSSVPSTKRLSEWLATKWAPVILRSYDIAGIRVGARPVYVLQPDENTIEIVWQELVEFSSVTSGKMIIKIGEKGITASRGAGDASKGFGLVSREPLPGEDILVRRLADAASQAMGKGLAVKVSFPRVVVFVMRVYADHFYLHEYSSHDWQKNMLLQLRKTQRPRMLLPLLLLKEQQPLSLRHPIPPSH